MDVFISYSSKDVDLVKDVCSLLKKNNVSYWVAAENDDYGEPYSASIISGINAAKIFLLFVSNASNQSEHVLRELNYAVNHNKPIIPILVGDVVLSSEFEYYLSINHFLSYSSSKGFNSQLLKRINEILNPSEAVIVECKTHIVA